MPVLTHSLRSCISALALCYASIFPNSGCSLRLDRCTRGGERWFLVPKPAFPDGFRLRPSRLTPTSSQRRYAERSSSAASFSSDPRVPSSRPFAESTLSKNAPCSVCLSSVPLPEATNSTVVRDADIGCGPIAIQCRRWRRARSRVWGRRAAAEVARREWLVPSQAPG